MPDGYWADAVPESVPHLLVLAGSGERSALYIDGVWDIIGDHYLIDERIRKLAGVVTVQSDDFLLGGDGRSDTARTVDDVLAYRRSVDAREAEARALEAQADELRQRAADIRRHTGD